ncbi:sugar-binding protein, partial [Micromonospora sp. NPDC005171]
MHEHGGLRLLSRPRRAVAVVVAASLVAGLLSGSPAVAKPKGVELAKAPATSPGQSVKGVKPLPTKFVAPPDDAKSSFKPTRTAWPKAASAEVDLPAASEAGARVAAQTKTRLAGMPVWAQPVTGKTAPRSLKVKVADRKVAEAAGVDGVLLSVDSGAGAGSVRVGVDYAGFAEAFGGNYGSRLRLVRLPACALTTPTRSECRVASPLVSSNDAGAKSVSAEVPMAADAHARAAGGVTVLAAVAAAGEEGGKGGTYAATDLKPSGSWTGGGSTGSFTYSYPVTVPPAASDLVPTVALSYDSGSVDGQTASTNAQSSWVGDGWSTPRSYVEQTFAS